MISIKDPSKTYPAECARELYIRANKPEIAPPEIARLAQMYIKACEYIDHQDTVIANLHEKLQMITNQLCELTTSQKVEEKLPPVVNPLHIMNAEEVRIGIGAPMRVDAGRLVLVPRPIKPLEEMTHDELSLFNSELMLCRNTLVMQELRQIDERLRKVKQLLGINPLAKRQKGETVER